MNINEENCILDGSISNFNNIFPTYISEKNPKFLEIDDKYIGGLIIYNYSNKFTDIIFKNILDSNLNINRLNVKNGGYKNPLTRLVALFS